MNGNACETVHSGSYGYMSELFCVQTVGGTGFHCQNTNEKVMNKESMWHFWWKWTEKAKAFKEYEAIFMRRKQYIRTQVLDRLCNLKSERKISHMLKYLADNLDKWS